MAKHPVPKKKVSQARTASRYASFAVKKKNKLKGLVHVVVCESCGNPRLNQCACKKCGKYRGRSVIDMGKMVDKITRVKA